jgi:hypothetical protein
MQLLEFAIFSVCVAGKNSDQTAKKVDQLWRDKDFRTTLTVQWSNPPMTDTEHELYVKLIRQFLVTHKIGQYDRLSRVIMWLNQNCAKLDTILFNTLVNFRGIGPKTAAFFLLHSRSNASIPVIDTHICKYMATSNLAKYLENARIVKEWIEHDFPGMTLAQADLHLWTQYSGRATKVDPKQRVFYLADAPTANTGLSVGARMELIEAGRQSLLTFQEGMAKLTANDMLATFGDPNTREV